MESSTVISSKIKTILGDVEKKIEKICNTEVKILRETALATLNAGGKRLRPALVLIAGQVGKYNEEKLVSAAAAVELIHMASLVHDDILDGAATRRGKPTINSQWGNTVAVTAGDFLFAQAFVHLGKLNNGRVIKAACDAALALSMGELHQMETTGNCDQLIRDYMEKIYKKTAALFSASCEIGSILAQAPLKETALLTEYGKNLGMAFQIYDDILDLEGSEETLGKPIGIDLKDGTVTLPILYALEDTNKDRRICSVIGKSRPEQAEVNEVIDLILATSALERTRREAHRYTQKAIETAKGITARDIRDDLVAIGEFVVARYH